MDTLMNAMFVPLIALQAADKQIDINISTGGEQWYLSPVWLAVGGLALIVLIMFIVMAVRGGGTTIVKE